MILFSCGALRPQALQGGQTTFSLPSTSSCSNQLRVYTMAAFQHTTSQNIFRSITIHRPSLVPLKAAQALSAQRSTFNSRPAHFQASGTQACSLSPLDPSAREEHTHVDNCGLMVRCTHILTFGCLNSIAGRTRFSQARAELGMTDRTANRCLIMHTVGDQL